MLDFFMSSVLAQDSVGQAAEKAQATPNALVSFLPFILIFFVFYFLMIRPQKKRMEEEQKLLSTLGKGDEVYTKSGMIGTISGLTEKIVTLEVADGVKIKFLRGQVGGMAKKIYESKESTSGAPAAK